MALKILSYSWYFSVMLHFNFYIWQDVCVFFLPSLFPSPSPFLLSFLSYRMSNLLKRFPFLIELSLSLCQFLRILWLFLCNFLTSIQSSEILVNLMPFTCVVSFFLSVNPLVFLFFLYWCLNLGLCAC
jgi:hypothetical protein